MTVKLCRCGFCRQWPAFRGALQVEVGICCLWGCRACTVGWKAVSSISGSPDMVTRSAVACCVFVAARYCQHAACRPQISTVCWQNPLRCVWGSATMLTCLGHLVGAVQLCFVVRAFSILPCLRAAQQIRLPASQPERLHACTSHTCAMHDVVVASGAAWVAHCIQSPSKSDIVKQVQRTRVATTIYHT
jgi:hypothetical protein